MQGGEDGRDAESREITRQGFRWPLVVALVQNYQDHC